VSAVAATGAPVFATPTFPRFRRASAASTASTEDDAITSAPTPVSITYTAPALREAIEQFAEVLDPLQDHEVIQVVLDPDGRDLIVFARAALNAPRITLRVGDVPRDDAISDGTADPLKVFTRVQAELGVTQRDMFAATGIKHRTFHSWKVKPASSRPRLASLGQLWRLADMLEDLREALGRPVGPWLHAKPERYAAFKAGRFDALVDLAVDVPRRSGKTIGASNQIGVTADVPMPIVKTAPSRVTAVKRGISR
jgi:hypothetical protein